MTEQVSEYDKQAEAFLNHWNLSVIITHLDNNPPSWDEDQGHNRLRYRITIKRKDRHKSLTFIFWDSIANAEKGERPTAYDVLACASADSNDPGTFEDFCGEFGYDTDSRKAEGIYKRVKKFADRLNAFFSEAELEELQEIR